MDTLEMYSPEYEVIDIFKALRKLNMDELIPDEDVFKFFYQHSRYPGVSFFLRYKNRTKFFYIDHDDFISEVKNLTPEWDVISDKNIIRISLLYKIRNSVVPVIFVFDVSKKEYRDLLIILRKKKVFKLYYLNILYGGLVLDSIIKFKVPSKVIDVLKKIK